MNQWCGSDGGEVLMVLTPKITNLSKMLISSNDIIAIDHIAKRLRLYG